MHIPNIAAVSTPENAGTQSRSGNLGGGPMHIPNIAAVSTPENAGTQSRSGNLGGGPMHIPNIAAVSTPENAGTQSQSGNLGGGHVEEHAMERPKDQGTQDQQQKTFPGGISSSEKHPAEVDSPPTVQKTQDRQQKTTPSQAAEAGHFQPSDQHSYNFRRGQLETSVNSQQPQHFRENQPSGIAVPQQSVVNIAYQVRQAQESANEKSNGIAVPQQSAVNIANQVRPPQESTNGKCVCCVVL